MSDFTYNLPDVGEGLSEGEIVHWHVSPGDAVSADQIIVDVQTDKAVVEIPAPVAGTMKSLGGSPGDMVPVGAMLAVIETAGAAPKPEPETAKTETPKPAAAPAPRAAGKRPLASPATRKLAAELGVSLGDIAGSGPSGRITRDDVQRAAEGGAPAPVAAPAPAPAAPVIAPPAGEDRVEPLRGLRRQIANSMASAWRDIPHILTTHEVDATNLVAARAALNEELAADGIKLSYLPLFVKACVGALKRFPSFNASLDMERQEIVYRHRTNVGIATATPDGLIVPVVHDADRKSVVDIARDIEALAEAARARKVTVAQLQGGTFTISNYGSYGGTFGTPIIRPPEVAIAGFGAIRDTVVPVDGVPAVRPNLTLVVSCDHRLNDGEHLGAFSAAIAATLANPVRLLGQA
jgi:pyruvate dehydrogenase E2 component (dihydrolipoamide acetyltransferase)